MKYRKKPVVIEAVEWPGYFYGDMRKFIDPSDVTVFETRGEMIINTPEGERTVSKGDFIIKGIRGEYYPCKPDIFWATYERVEE